MIGNRSVVRDADKNFKQNDNKQTNIKLFEINAEYGKGRSPEQSSS